MIVKFPTRLKYISENPLVDFYRKCLNRKKNLSGVRVQAFFVNPKDYKRLTELTTKYVKRQLPGRTLKYQEYQTGLLLLDIAPCVDETIEIGTVRINKSELYDIKK